MITGELKNKIDSLWDIFAAGGLVNPLDVIEQITYLMFIRDLDDSDNLRAKESAMLGLPYESIFAGEVTIGERKVDGNSLKWSVFRDFPAGKMYSTVQEWVFPFIKNLDGNRDSAYSKYMDDAIFKLPTALLLSKVVDALDEIYMLMSKADNKEDVRGDTYEYLLNKIAQSGLNGQFRTPRHIIRMMVELMQPKPDDIICDPACGTSGFLVAAGEYLREMHKDEIFFNRQKKDHYMNHMFFGYDMDRTMLRIGAMNMMTHGVERPFIRYRDSLSDQNPDKDKYSLILANPPFKGSLDYDTVSADLLKVCKTKKTELLFLALFLRMLKIGGRCACIVPDGVLFGSSVAHKAIRKELIEGNRLEAVISMPSGVFKPYAGVSTGILIFTKTGHGGTDNVWFYDMQADGFSLDDKRTATPDKNDIPDIIERFRNLEGETERARTEKSFFVRKDEIVDNDYDLSINKYKKIEYVPIEYPSTAEIMTDLHELETEITKGLAELEEMLQENDLSSYDDELFAIEVKGYTRTTKCIIEAARLEDITAYEKRRASFKSGVMHDMIGFKSWDSAFSHVKSAVSKLSPSQTLYVTDPYLFAPAVLNINNYADSLFSLFDKNNFSDVYFITPTDSAHFVTAVYDDLKKRIEDKGGNVYLVASRKFHDRYWISSEKGAVTIGSSLTGIGKKICTIQEMNQTDYEQVLEMAKEIVK